MNTKRHYRRFMFMLTMLSAATFGIAQNITGRIIDEQSQPMPFANVVLVNRVDSTFIAGAVTKDDGTFTVKTDRNDGLLKVSSVGYQTQYIQTRQGNVGDIRMQPSNHTLGEVTVTANSAVLNKNKYSFIPSKKEKRISNGGYNLLYNMPISVLSVDPLSKSITTNMGDGVEMFINGIRATPAEVQNIRTEDVRKIEYLEQPTDPRFNNARYALNIVVATYDRGGYTKADGQQSFVTTAGAYSLYSHYEFPKMTYDLLGGLDYNRQAHLGDESKTNYDFTNLTMNRDEHKSGCSKDRQGYATLRAKYVVDSMVIANSIGVQINRTPYMDLSGSTSILSSDNMLDELAFVSHRNEKNYSVEWDGNYFFKLKNDFDLTSEFTAAYMNTAQNYDYSTTAGQNIINEIGEDAWNLKLNATLRKRIKRASFGINLISSFNGNAIHYRGTTPSDVKVRDWYIMPRAVFNYSVNKFRINGNLGVSYEEATYNGEREVYFFPKSFLSGGWNFDARNSLSFSFEYSMFGNSLGMKSPNLIMTDHVTAIKGNPKLKNFHFISPSISYKIIPDKRTTISLFTRWQYFNRPSVFVWEPMVYDGNRTIVVRSYTNAGYLSNFRLGASGTLRLLDNNLFIKGSVTQNYFKQGGLTEVNSWPVSISGQANYYIKNFSISAFWEKSSKQVSIFETKKRPESYFVAISYGNGNLIATFTCRNIFNSSWRTSEALYNSAPVNYDIQHFGNEHHRSFVLNLSYSFSYGKKTNTKDRINKSGMPGTAIVE